MKIRAKPPCGQFIDFGTPDLFVYVSGMVFHRPFRNIKSGGNVFFACTPSEQFRNFGLAFG